MGYPAVKRFQADVVGSSKYSVMLMPAAGTPRPVLRTCVVRGLGRTSLISEHYSIKSVDVAGGYYSNSVY